MGVIIKGGLGNQMFEYAFKLKIDYLTKKNTPINVSSYEKYKIFNGFELKRLFNIEYTTFEYNKSIFIRVLNKIYYIMKIPFLVLPNKIIESCAGNYYKKLNKKRVDKYIFDGWWQSEKYFLDIENKIRETFIFPIIKDDKNLSALKIIKSNNCVAVHIRRGDYLNPKSSAYICLGNSDYYIKAITYIKNKINNPYFIVFSDDIEWVRKNLDVGKNSLFVDWNKKENSFRDMQLMSLCNHNIIANSTFSWWGAWLNDNPNKIVVAPYLFFNNRTKQDDIIPDSWVKIKFKEA